MSYPTTLNLIGGQGGSSFSFTGEKNGASLEKIGVWVGEWQVRAVRAWLSDGRKETFGKPDGPYQEYTFQAGECFTSLSLWGNGAGTRLGAIKFRTSLNKEFFVKMTKWGLKAEYPMEIGSGICLGIVGKGGADIDCMGFMFLNEVESAVLTNIKYPTINQMIPKVKVEEIKSVTYTNDSAVSQKQRIEGSKKVTKKSSWSHTNSFSTTISVEVKAGVPEVVEVSGSFGFTVGTESTYERETTDETTETWSSDIEVPPRTRVVVDISIGRCSFDLPYTGKMQITCNNGSVLEYETKGQYKGLTYSEVKINTKQFVL